MFSISGKYLTSPQWGGILSRISEWFSLWISPDRVTWNTFINFRSESVLLQFAHYHRQNHYRQEDLKTLTGAVFYSHTSNYYGKMAKYLLSMPKYALTMPEQMPKSNHKIRKILFWNPVLWDFFDLGTRNTYEKYTGT